MIKIIDGDLFDTDCQIIAHQVNCRGVMSSGVALQVKKKYPQAYKSYKIFLDTFKKSSFGKCQTVQCEGKIIANLFGQDDYGYGKQQTDLSKLQNGLSELRKFMIDAKIKSVAFPYKMSSDRGGANWDDVLELIKECFENFDVKIYKLG